MVKRYCEGAIPLLYSMKDEAKGPVMEVLREFVIGDFSGIYLLTARVDHSTHSAAPTDCSDTLGCLAVFVGRFLITAYSVNDLAQTTD